MKLRIDRSIDGVVCLQMQLDDRAGVVEYLRRVMGDPSKPLHIPAGDEWVIIEVNDAAFTIEVMPNGLRFRLPAWDLIELIEAIEEHIQGDSALPLDHSCEAFGASIVGEGITDVVVETVADTVPDEEKAEHSVADPVLALLRTGRKMEAIALLRKDRGLSLLEATASGNSTA